MRICCKWRCYLTVCFFYVFPVQPPLQIHFPFLLGTLNQICFVSLFFGGFLTPPSNEPNNSTEKQAKVLLIAFSGSDPFRFHFQMPLENEVSRTWSFTHHDINQPSKAFFAIWATVFSRKSAHQRACGWQHILGYYCSERGRLLLSEPDSISFYDVLKGHCALSSVARVSFTGWKSKLWGLAQLSGLGVAPSWDVQPSSV